MNALEEFRAECDAEIAKLTETEHACEYWKAACKQRDIDHDKATNRLVEIWRTERDEWKAKAEEYRLRVADYECDLVRNEGECRCFTIPPKMCVRDNRMCQEVLKAVDGDDR